MGLPEHIVKEWETDPDGEGGWVTAVDPRTIRRWETRFAWPETSGIAMPFPKGQMIDGKRKWPRWGVLRWIDRNGAEANLRALEPTFSEKAGQGVPFDEWPLEGTITLYRFSQLIGSPAPSHPYSIARRGDFPDKIPGTNTYDLAEVRTWVKRHRSLKSLRCWVDSTWKPPVARMPEHGELDARGIAQLFGIELQAVKYYINNDLDWPNCIPGKPGIYRFDDISDWHLLNCQTYSTVAKINASRTDGQVIPPQVMKKLEHEWKMRRREKRKGRNLKVDHLGIPSRR